jgi:hypothetical protein
MEEFGYKNPMQVPRLEKIVINMGVGEASATKKVDGGAETWPDRRPEAGHHQGARAKSIATSSCARACRSAPR